MLRVNHVVAKQLEMALGAWGKDGTPEPAGPWLHGGPAHRSVWAASGMPTFMGSERKPEKLHKT